MTDFIDNPRFYASIEEYHAKKCEWIKVSMEHEALEVQREQERFRPEDLKRFKHVVMTSVVPVDLKNEMECRTRMFEYDKEMEDWLDANKEKTPVEQRLYVDAILEAKRMYSCDNIKNDYQNGMEWLETTYLPRNDFMAPLTEREMEYIASNMDAKSARLISQGKIQNCGCIKWEGPLQSARRWAYMERRRKKVGSKKRSGGKVQDLMYNFLCKPLTLKDRVHRTCEEVSCINPYHTEVKISGNRKRKR